MSTTIEETGPFEAELIEPEHWQAVRDLIDDVNDEEAQHAFAQRLFNWWSAVRQFRRTEFRHMRQNQAADGDLRYHRLCLSALITGGEVLALELEHIKGDGVLTQLGIAREDVGSCVETLRRNWGEWHAEVSSERVAALRGRIFGDG